MNFTVLDGLSELRDRKNWVCWCLELDEETDPPHWDKIPYTPRTGGKALANKSETWGLYGQAKARCLTTDSRYSGPGFEFTPPLVAIDWDNVVDPQTGAVDDDVLAAVRRLGTYTERSPRGAGLHTIGLAPDLILRQGEKRAALPPVNGRARHIEIYNSGRFFTMTGRHEPWTPREIRDVTGTLDEIRARFLPQRAPAARVATTATGPSLADQDILNLADSAQNRDKFTRLWDGNASDYPSSSEADAALCCLLAFYTRDPDQIDRLFCQSGLYREKWDRPDYKERTIASALGLVTESYSGSNPRETPITLTTATSRLPEQPRTNLPDSLMQTDAGNALRLKRHHGDDLLYCHASGTWYAWDGCRYREDDTGEIERRAKSTAVSIAHEAAAAPTDEARKVLLSWAAKSLSESKIMGMIALARSEMPVRRGDLDTNPWLLNCLNGVLDLRTGQLGQHTRDLRLTKLAPVEYDPQARSDTWERVLHDATGGDVAFMEFLQDCAGYSLCGDKSEEKVLLVIGPAATGKSTYLEALKATLGADYARTADFRHFLEQRGSGTGATSHIARLAGARLVTGVETKEDARMAEALVKWLTGGDTIVARFLYKEEFEFRPTFTIWLASNYPPKVRDDDDAVWRRIVRVPFTRVVPESKRDPEVKATLSDPARSGAAILAWAVKGCLRWQQRGLVIPPVVQEATKHYRLEMDVLANFLEDCCVVGPDKWASSASLHEAYATWARENHEQHPLSKRALAERLKRHDFIDEKRSGARGWLGVGILEEREEPEEKDDKDWTHRTH